MMMNALSHLENSIRRVSHGHDASDIFPADNSEFSSIRTISLENIFQSPAAVEHLYNRRGADYCLSETIKLVKVLQSPLMQKYTRRFQQFLVELFKTKKLNMALTLESTILLGQEGIRIRGKMNRFHGYEGIAKHIGYLGPAHSVFERMIEKLSAAIIKKDLILLKNISSYSLKVWTRSSFNVSGLLDFFSRRTIISSFSIGRRNSLRNHRAKYKFWVGQAQDAIRAGDKHVASIVLPGRMRKGKRESGIYQNWIE